jgi:hypothetical protein
MDARFTREVERKVTQAACSSYCSYRARAVMSSLRHTAGENMGSIGLSRPGRSTCEYPGRLDAA